MQNSSRLALYHYWVAFAAFLPAVVLGAWQMLMRSPLPAPLDDSNAYYTSVTLHGTAMAYVVTTFFAMGFGYAVTATSLGRPVRGVTAAWGGFVICLIGTLMAVVIVLSGRATVLYTFYPPLLGSAWYYFGVLLLVGGSMIWVVLMIYNMATWKRDNPGQPVPLAMFAITATALLWAWAASGVVVELLGVVLPRALGLTTQINAGLARTLFSVTLHAIVYFWLMPAYIAFYTLVPQTAGGRLYSDTMGRLTFIMFLVFSVPVGMHHLFADPEHGAGLQVPPLVPDVLRRPADAADGVLDLRQPGTRRACARRPRAVGLDPGIAVEGADGARGCTIAGDARPRRVRRAHQHELRHELHDSQYVVGDGAFPSDLRRRGRDHVFRGRLRDVAAHHREAVAVQDNGALATLALVLGHDDRYHSVAYYWIDGTAAARRHLRLQRSVRCPYGSAGHHIGHRRRDPAGVCDPPDRYSSAVATR